MKDDLGKIRILHVITRLDKGGSSENTLLSAIGLAEKGYRVDILFGETKDADLRLLQKAEKAGVEFIEEEDLVRDIRPFKDISAFFDILRFLRDVNYDIVHTHSSKAGFIARYAAKFAGVKKIIYTPHGHVFYGYFGKPLTRMVMFAEAMASHVTDKIVGLTPAECEEWIAFGIGKKEQYTVIPSGVDFGLMDEGILLGRDFKEELGIPKDKVLIGSVGHFVPIKGYEYFIKAAIALAKEKDDVFFLLAGNGPLHHKYREMIDEAGMGNRFHLIGWQINTWDIIKTFDIFVLPSLNEGMGRGIVEALYLSKPVITTRVGGVPSIVSEGAGILVEPASEKALLEAMKKVLDDPEESRKMAKKGRDRVTSGYSSIEMVDKLDKLYKKLLG